MIVLELLGLVAAGTVVGVMSALFGVGGGILIVPFLVAGLGEAQHIAEGTSLLVMLPGGLSGAYAHSKRGHVSLPHSRLLALGGVAGSVLGATVALSLPASTLTRIFGIVLGLVGVRTVRRGIATRRRELADERS